MLVVTASTFFRCALVRAVDFAVTARLSGARSRGLSTKTLLSLHQRPQSSVVLRSCPRKGFEVLSRCAGTAFTIYLSEFKGPYRSAEIRL